MGEAPDAPSTKGSDAVLAESSDTIRSFLRFDRLAAALGLAIVSFAWLADVGEEGLLLFVAASIGVLIAALSLGLRAVDRAEVAASLAFATSGNWLVAVVVAWTVPQLWPVMIMTVLMPVVLATPFVADRMLAALLVGAAIVVALVSFAGLVNDDGGVFPDLEDELEVALVIGAVVALTIPIALIARNNSRLLQRRLRRLAALNEQLAASQADLAASRRRVVEAADDARRQIERDLHDGAQQQLVALGVRLRLLESKLGDDHELAPHVRALVSHAHETADELRQLAHGIYPQLLGTSGLGAALRVAIRRSGLSVDTDLDDHLRLGDHEEQALYFVALEALANAGKYAPEASIRIRFVADEHEVRLDVDDDGPGFDPDDVQIGRGTENMADRMASIGGELEITAALGQGTAVTACLPVSNANGDTGVLAPPSIEASITSD